MSVDFLDLPAASLQSCCLELLVSDWSASWIFHCININKSLKSFLRDWNNRSPMGARRLCKYEMPVCKVVTLQCSFVISTKF